MEICKKINEVFAEFKKLGVFALSADPTEITAQMSAEALRDLNLEVSMEMLSHNLNYPFRVYSVVDSVKFFTLVTKGGLKKHFPHLVEEEDN